MNTPEQQAVEQAFKLGLPIEARDRETDDWFDCTNPTWKWVGWEYRVKGGVPTVKRLRPWRIEEVPVGAFISWKDGHSGKSIILAAEGNSIYDDSIYRGAHTTDHTYSPEYAMIRMEWSWCGSIWAPCGVME